MRDRRNGSKTSHQYQKAAGAVTPAAFFSFVVPAPDGEDMPKNERNENRSYPTNEREHYEMLQKRAALKPSGAALSL